MPRHRYQDFGQVALATHHCDKWNFCLATCHCQLLIKWEVLSPKEWIRERLIRSWCVADLPGTRKSGDTDRQASPDGPLEETPPSGGEGKNTQPEKDTLREKKLPWSGSHE